MDNDATPSPELDETDNISPMEFSSLKVEFLNSKQFGREYIPPNYMPSNFSDECDMTVAERMEKVPEGNFRSSKTVYSHSSYHTASSGHSTYYSTTLHGDQDRGLGNYHPSPLRELQEEDEYAKLLRSRRLWPVNSDVEQNWSGLGQHVVLEEQGRKFIDDILQVQHFLGSTSTAIVQSVKCRRIQLARKTIRCTRSFTKQQAVDEVAHLTRLEYPHIVRVIGTYIIGKELSILMFPVADYNLEEFIDAFNAEEDMDEWSNMAASLTGFFPCLAGAVDYVHNRLTKHMDLKPKNVLVRNITGFKVSGQCSRGFKVYLADFGIARSYNTLEATETDGPTRFTRKYAAPEVVARQKRGLSADIFSLGCVFLEMWAALQSCAAWTAAYKPVYGAIDHDYEKNYSLLVLWVASAGRIAESSIKAASCIERILLSNQNEDSSYQANLEGIQEYLNTFKCDERTTVPDYLALMLSGYPQARPTAEKLAIDFGEPFGPCGKEPDPLAVRAVQVIQTGTATSAETTSLRWPDGRRSFN